MSNHSKGGLEWFKHRCAHVSLQPCSVDGSRAHVSVSGHSKGGLELP